MLEGLIPSWLRRNYGLSVQEFATPPKKFARKYESLQKVTRENFTAVLCESFAISQGIPTLQKIYLE